MALSSEPAGPRIRVMIISTVGFTLMFMVWLMLGVLGIPIRNELHLTDSQFEWLIATAILSGSLLRLNFGIWADRYGGRITMTILLLVTAGSAYLFSHGAKLRGHARLRTALWSVRKLVRDRHFVELRLVSARAKGNGTRRVRRGQRRRSGTKLLVVLVPTMLTLVPAAGYWGGWIPGGWRIIPVAYAVLLLVMAGLTWWLCPTPDRMPGKGRPMAEMLAPLKYTRVWRLSLYYIVVFGAYVALSGWLPKYYIDTYGMPLRTAALLTASFIFPASLLRPLGGYLSDRYGPRVVTYAVFIDDGAEPGRLVHSQRRVFRRLVPTDSGGICSSHVCRRLRHGHRQGLDVQIRAELLPQRRRRRRRDGGPARRAWRLFPAARLWRLGRWTGVPQTAFVALLVLTLCSLVWLHVVVVRLRAESSHSVKALATAPGTHHLDSVAS